LQEKPGKVNMLVLTRKIGEAICIGDDVELVISDILKNAVRIGVRAPKNMPIYRKEIYERILVENQEASTTAVINSQLDDLNKLINKRIKQQ
jgi:carbon storage regulator